MPTLFSPLLIYNETCKAYIGLIIVDNKNHHCMIIETSLIFYLQDIVKDICRAWLKFPSSTLEPFNIMSCVHLDQDEPKSISR